MESGGRLDGWDVAGVALDVAGFVPGVGAVGKVAKVAGKIDDVAGVARAVDKGYDSFAGFKRAMGPAGKGQAWHHVVEQTPGNVVKFGPQAIHNTQNMIKLPHGAGSIHNQISGYYSSVQPFTKGQTVRQWLSTQNYQTQSNFGRETLTKFGWMP